MKTKKIGLGILVAAVVTILTVGVASALPRLPEKLPEVAKKASPAINDDTNELKAPPEFVADLPESVLTKIVFIRYAPGKEPVCDYDGICDSRENWKTCPDCTKGGEEEPKTACYDFLAGSKPKWNWVEDYYYSTSELGTTSVWATKTWDDVTSATIFGSGVSEALDWGVYDYKNSVSFGNYEDPNVIGVTAIWFRGKNIYEYDIMFDLDYFNTDGTVKCIVYPDPVGEICYDLPTVTLHEFGHGAGLNDLYDSVCSGNVMYGYYEGVKTTLGDGDKAGIQKLYGSK